MIAGTALPTDQLLRALVWLLFANALGFIASNSVQLGQRLRYAQSLLLKELLSTDSMTGIGNRRRFDDALDREWRRRARSGKPLSLIMIDVDHFKAYNDFHGHLQGDECLRQVATLLVAGVGRPGDLVTRYGGEEFVCLLPEVGEEGARAAAVKFIMAIARAGISHGSPGSSGAPVVDECGNVAGQVQSITSSIEKEEGKQCYCPFCDIENPTESELCTGCGTDLKEIEDHHHLIDPFPVLEGQRTPSNQGRDSDDEKRYSQNP